MGERLRDIYPHATRWEVIKWKFRRLMRRLAWCSLAGFLLASAFILGTMRVSAIEYVRGETIDLTPQKIGELKKHVMSMVAACESPGYKEGDDAIIWDTNNKASVGPFKFQITTMQHYYQALNGKTITKSEAVSLAMNYDEAEKVAEYVWFETGNGPKDWVNCNKWHDIQEKVDFIKQMEK